MGLDGLTAWRDAVDTAVGSVVSGFEAMYGYPPGRNIVEDPDQLGLARLSAAGSAIPVDLLVLYAAVGAVSLPDFGNGLFLHSPEHVAGTYTRHELRRTTGRHQADVVVSASDGGGTLYALASPTGSPVYRLPASSLVSGVYHSDDPRFEVIAANLAGFLGYFCRAIEWFAATGDVVDL